MKRTRMNVLIVAMLILCAALSMGCVDDKDISNALDTPASVFVEKPTEEQTQVPLSEDQYEDSEYLMCSLVHSEILLTCFEEITRSANKADYEALEISGRDLQTHSTRALRDLKRFNISPSLKPSDKEYTLYLEDLYLSGVHLEKGAKYHIVGDIQLSIYYTGEATDHLERSIALLP